MRKLEMSSILEVSGTALNAADHQAFQRWPINTIFTGGDQLYPAIQLLPEDAWPTLNCQRSHLGRYRGAPQTPSFIIKAGAFCLRHQAFQRWPINTIFTSSDQLYPAIQLLPEDAWPTLNCQRSHLGRYCGALQTPSFIIKAGAFCPYLQAFLPLWHPA
jgi:hypothetical protein